jgi:hypothetical protein
MNDQVSFDLSRNLSDRIGAETFELQQTSVFAVLDFSIIKIQGGWIFRSNYLVDGEKTQSPGNGFFVSIQGIIPFGKR